MGQASTRWQACSRHSSSRHSSSGSGTQALNASSQSHASANSQQTSIRRRHCRHHQQQQRPTETVRLKMTASPRAGPNHVELLTLPPAGPVSWRTPPSDPAEAAAARSRTWRWWMPRRSLPRHPPSSAAPLLLPRSRSHCSGVQARTPVPTGNSRTWDSSVVRVMRQPQRRQRLLRLPTHPGRRPAASRQLLHSALGRQQELWRLRLSS